MEYKSVSIPRTTLDFFVKEYEDVCYYMFDARECSPPEPMVNTMNALVFLKENDILIGKFFHTPEPLLLKIEAFFDYTIHPLEDGGCEIHFQKKITQ